MVPGGNFLFIHLRRLISGILSIVLSLVILLQSCAVGMLEAMGADGSDSASGLLVALLLVAAGIVAIVTRNGSRGGSIALVVLYAVAAVIGFSATVYADLSMGSLVLCLRCRGTGFASAQAEARQGCTPGRTANITMHSARRFESPCGPNVFRFPRKKVLTNGAWHGILSLACRGNMHGGVAQLARACGSYPQCHWFESSRRYHKTGGMQSCLTRFPQQG